MRNCIILIFIICALSHDLYAQNLPAATANGSSSTTSTSYVDVTGASVSISANAGNKVLVVATFTGKTTSGSAEATYRIVDDETHVSGEIQRTHGGSYGIGSVVYIFDVTATGTRTYTFQHKTTAQTLETAVQINAISLYDGTNQLNSDVKTLASPVTISSATYETALESNVVTTTATGGFYVSASIQSAKTSGIGTVVGEWVLQYKLSSSGTWRDLSYPVSRSTSGTGKGVVNLVAALPNTSEAGDYYFRVAHRKTSGTDPYETQACNLVSVGLGTGDGFFPVMIASKPSATISGTTFADVISNKVLPQTATDLFLHSQYNMRASALTDSPKFDLYAKQDATVVFDGADHSRYLSSTTDRGSGASSGLITGMASGTTYDVSLRHASLASITLTTENSYLVGIGTNRSSLPLVSPITVNATEGLASSSYSKLKDAFDAINSGTFNGEITIMLHASTTETATAELFASGAGLANYTSVIIYPTTTGISVSGNLAAPIINLNDADNVIFDGRVNQTGSIKSLTIANTNTGGAVIQYINDASSNTFRYCIIQGVTTSATNGLIFFSTGSATGNDSNTIEYCDIRDGATTPANAIYSAGSSVGADNSGISITNCNIFNYFSATLASNGILIASNSSAWTITGNRFFQTATRTATAASIRRAIQILTSSGVNYTVSNNIIGFADESGTGTTTYNGAFANLFRAIELTIGTNIASSVQGNTISGISLSTTSGLTSAPGIFTGISVLAGNANIGTGTGNTIGATTGTGAISITSTTSLGYIAGIYATSTGTVSLQNNNIGSISTGGTATIGYTFYGINTAGTGGNFSISSNIIGSTSTANSIAVGTSGTTTTGVCTFYGISNTATGVNSITNNTVQNTSTYGTGASVYYGINNSGGTATLNITENSVISGTNTGTGAFVGITNSAAVSTLNLNNNVIRNHTKTAVTGTFTAISNSGAVLNAININYNQLGNASGNLITYTVANSAALLGISNIAGAASCELSIQHNDIRGIVYSSTAGTNAHTYYINSAVTLKQDINYNTLTELSVNTTGGIIFISNNVAMPANGVQNINNNSIVSSFTRTAASGALTLFTSTTATNNTGVTVNNNNNNFSNITISGAATIAGWINQDAGLGTYSKTIDGNTFNNWNAGTGAVTALNVNIASTNNAVKNNIITNINTAGTITGITTGAGNDNVFLNTINNLNSTGGSAGSIVSGIIVTAGTTKNIYSNTISNLTGNTLTTGSVNGIYVQAGTTVNVYQNTIFGISSNATTSGTVNGIWAIAGTTVTIDRNKIYDIACTSAGVTGSIQGIQVSGATANLNLTISNNMIGDIRAPLINHTTALRGISLASTGTTSNNFVYYNTIYLNASSTGADFGSIGIYHVSNATATTASLDMRNNIIINLSTPNGAGLTVAYRRSSGNANRLANYASTSNNNLFYAGIPGANRLIYYDGTSSAQTLAAYKAGVFTAGTIAPRDQASVTENPSFLSTTGADANFLHIDAATATRIESGAVNIPSFTIDYDGNIRQGNSGYTGTSATSTDIGADEGDFTLIDGSAPSITYSLITSNSCTTSQNLSASINDATGVNTTSGTRPRIYFKRSTDSNTFNDNTSGTAGWKWVETPNTSSPFSFTLDYTLLNGGTGITSGSIVQYFVVAQDIMATPNIGINAGTFASAPSSVALTTGAFPIGGTLNSFTILAGLSGTVTIGASGTYTTLTGAGGLFSDINTKGLKGNLVATIMDANITETGANSLNAILYGCENNYTLTIQPNTGLAATLTGSVAGPLINLNGADNVIIDGLNSGGSSLTIQNTSTAATATTIRFIGDASNNSITNCNIEGSGTGTALGTILFSTGISTGNDGNTISNNTIRPAGANLPTNAIYSAGTSVGIDNSGNAISNNNIHDYFNAGAASNGIFIASNSSAWTISGNKFFQTATRTATTGVTRRDIQIVTALGVNYTVNNNIIGYANASSTGVTTYGGAVANLYRAIELTVGTSAPSNVQGNTIAAISFSTTSGSTTLPGVFSGISVLAGTVNIGTSTGNTIGATTGTGSIIITSTTSLGVITGIYANSSSTASIQNNNIGAISTGGTALIGYTFHGIYTAGGGQITTGSNIIGSTSTVNSITIGTNGVTTTAVCTLNGIANTATGTISIAGNTIQNVSVYGTSTSVFNGVLNSGVTGLIDITGNRIISVNNTGLTTGTTNMAGWLRAISNTAAVTTININNNIIRNLTKNVAGGNVFGISNSGAVLTTININSNQLGNADGGFITYSVANSIILTGISNTAGAANCAISIQNNDFQGISYSVAGTNPNTYIINTAATLSQNISGNTFTNLSVKTTGAIIFISNNVIMPTNGVQNINSNSIVTGFTRSAASGAITLFTSTSATSNANVTVNNNNNNFSNITISGTATIAGWINTDAGLGNVTKTIDGNTFSNWTGGTGTITVMNVNITSTNNATKNNNINTISSAGTIFAITTGAGNDNIFSNTIHTLVSAGTAAKIVNGIAVTGGTVKNVYQNTIYNLQVNNITTGSVSGIAISGGMTNYIYRNKISNISSSSSAITTGTVNGILVSGAIADQITTIHNNRIGDLRATAANVADPIRGLSIANTGLRSTSNIYYNTIYLNASSTGTDFGSSGIYHAASASYTTARLNLRNNIIVNTSTYNGTGLTVAYRRSAGTANTLNNYAGTSNNNLFYAGTQGAGNLLFTDGTSSAQTITDYKAGSFTAGTISPRDQLSISENPVFISTSGSSADFLKINTSEVTFIESGALNISGITTDFESDVRAGNPGYPAQLNGFGTAPDIGADEFDGNKPRVVVTNANVNSNGNYFSLGEALSAINAQDQTGKDMLVSVIGNTTETTSAILNAGNWTTLKIFPTVAGLTIAGNLDGVPLIDLNGADKVTIDGRVNQTGSTVSLNITNNSISATAGTSTIRFINSAETNTVKYCNITGSSTNVTDGIVTFSTSSGGVGNDNNLIDNCSITSAGSNRPVNTIYSSGTSSRENSTVTISNNKIYNFLNPSASSNGINIGAFSDNWVITDNSFYETTSFVPSTGTYSYNAIKIDNTSGDNYTVSGNFIGGQAELCGGLAWSADASTNHSFRAISLNVGTVTASTVQNNTIRNWNYRSASATPWRAIEVNAGAVNIGTVTANRIGSNTGTGSITVTATANAESFGISVGSTGTVNVSLNQIGSVSCIGNDTDVSHSFTAIYKSGVGGTLSITQNVIGSAGTSNSIYANSAAATSTEAQHLSAIYSESTGTVTISQNTIANLNNAYNGTLSSRTRAIYTTAGISTITRNHIDNLSTASLGTNGAVIGIELNGTDGANTVSENTVHDLSNIGTSFSGYIAGIYFTGSTGANEVDGNFIHSLSVNSSTTSASIYGIRIASGATTYSNNIISLGGNTASTLYGIYETGATSNNNSLYFNTVYIGGSLGSGVTNKSYSLFSNASTNTRNFRNNVFANFRSTTGGSSLHYASYLNYGVNTNLTLDYNNYYAPGTGGVIGYYNSTDKTTLPIEPSQDVNSSAVNSLLANAGGTSAVDYKLLAALNGVIGTGISLDYGLTARGSPPNMGAWEYNTNRWIGTTSTNFATATNWSSGAVPIEGVPIVFDDAPVRDCYLDADRIVSDILNNQSTYKLVVNGHQLTINGTLYFTGGAKIDATAAASSVVFGGNEAQTISDGAFVDNTIHSLTILNDFGLTTESDLIVDDVLNLQSANPSLTKGCLDVATSKTLTLGGSSTTIGDGDVTGIISRTTIVANTTYTFGNRLTTLYFPATGTLPTSISVKISIGAAPSWRAGAIKRVYEIIQTGASALDPTAATITSAYRDSELNGNDEGKLVNWSFRSGVNWLFEHGRASHNSTENWIRLTNINMAFFPSSFGQVEVGIDEGVLETLTWNGSVSTSWTTVNNWTPMGAPSDYLNIIIPDAATTTFDPSLPPETTIKTIKLESGSILNSINSAQATIIGGVGAWVNEGGTFNPGTSTVVFNNEQSSFSGSTDFNNVTINSGTTLQMLEGCTMRISGVMNNSGTWRTVVNGATTVEYYGSNQTVVVPNPATNRYSTLILSGSGIKTMPATILSAWGNLILSGTVSVTALNNLVVNGNFSIGAGASFVAGAYNHSIGGNLTHDGTFTATGSTFTFTGLAAQTISGSAVAATTFSNISVLTEFGITSNRNITVNGILDLQMNNPTSSKGCLDMGTNTVLLGASSITTGPGDITGIVRRTTINANIPYTFSNSYTTVQFAETGTLPTAVSIKLSLGNAPAWKLAAVKRVYEFVRTGGSGSVADVSVNYLSDELNSNNQEKLVYWGYSNPTTFEWGRSEIDTTNHWLLLRNVPIDLWPTGFGQMVIALAETANPTLTWDGSVSTVWDNANNWTPSGFPNQFSNIIIPNATATPNDPVLPSGPNINSLVIQSGGVLNTGSGTEFNIYADNGNGWTNSGGTFNAGNSTVVFRNQEVTISGSTNFNNLSVLADSKLTPLANNTMRIAGVLSNEGILDATANSNTIEYNGSTQTVILPNGVIPGYHSLTLSGSDVKTLPSEILQLNGDFSLTGSASTTLLNEINIGGALSIGSNAALNTDGKYITLAGNITHDGVFTMGSSTIELVGSTSQSISGTASSTIFSNLLVHQTYGFVCNKNITVNVQLCLHYPNPGATVGLLTMNTYTLDFGSSATQIGPGDVTGIVRRTTIERNTTYTFGNRSTTISFNDAGTLPTEISARISIGTAPSWRAGAIQRTYEIIQTGANPLDATQATIHSAYLDSELNGNDENRLVNWSYRNPTGTFLEHGRSNLDATENWLELTNINMAFFPSTFGTLYITVDESEIENLTWNGSVSSSWTTVDNWSPNGAPSSFVNVTIPDASATPNDPDLNYRSEVKTLTIATGGILNSSVGTTFNIYGGVGAWRNYGTFNSGNTDVIFNHVEATIAGESNFHSLTISNGASLTPLTGNIMRIGLSLNNSGTLHASANSNTIEYNGSAQTVILPNGTTPGYHSLTISGSGIKTMPSAALSIYGNLTLSDVVNITALNNLDIKGNLSVNSQATFVTGAFNHLIGGDFTHDGIFTAIGSNITFNGSSPQLIKGSSSATSFNNLTISSGGGVTCNKNISLIGNLTVSSGILDLSTFSADRATAGGILTVANGATLKIGGTNTMLSNYATHSFDATSNIDYSGSNQTVSNEIYGHLTLGGSGVKILPAATFQIIGNLSLSGSAATTTAYNLTIGANLNLSNTSVLTIGAAKTFTVSGAITNTAGSGGLVLQSNVNGTASLIHNTNGVAATIERYIGGAAENWHFLSSPISNQPVSGSWLPTGTYGNGTGYDLYVWNEPTPCWVYQLNTTVIPNWPAVHPSANFVPGRGYLYSVQAVNTTKEFAGNLNNGNVSYGLTADGITDVNLQGFNLVGNPYPSSIDWKAATGWTRTNLLTSGSGYDMWIWNPVANNYGVYNSADASDVGTNAVTRYIPSMQGFFVRAQTAGNLQTTNDVRVHDETTLWKSGQFEPNRFIAVVNSETDHTFDEVRLLFGYPENKAGAAKLFSPVTTAPSLYLANGEVNLSIRYLTDRVANPHVPLLFKAGRDGYYTINFDFDNFDIAVLEDRLTGKFTDLSLAPDYRFNASKSDNENRFIIHFGAIPEKANMELPAHIYMSGGELVVDLTLVDEITDVKVVDVLGRTILQKDFNGNSIHKLVVNVGSQIVIVYAKSNKATLSRKVFVH